VQDGDAENHVHDEGRPQESAAHRFVFYTFFLNRTNETVGTTMGSRQDLVEATVFMAEHKITPLVDRVLEGLDASEEGFNLLKNGEQFGKIVIRLGPPEKKANL
jgi:D-arabinose 1-dehydrogenase-like Zn-dependent alcohol dehydrogenase